MGHVRLTQTEKDIVERISRRRRQCLIHRYVYYVKAQTLIDDFTYDMLERDLKALVEANPELAKRADLDGFCPARSVGSSNLDDYPRHIEMVAESLLKFAPPTT